MSTDFTYRIRRAADADAGRLRTMQERSLRALGRSFYAADLIDRFIRQVGTMDAKVLAEGHYFLAVDTSGAVVASGGWSRLQPGYVGPGETAGSAAAEPTVRAVYVDPDHARRGLGSAIMRQVEADAVAAGIRMLHLAATLSGIGLYERLGYARGRRRSLVLPDGTPFPVVEMHKRQSASAPVRAA